MKENILVIFGGRSTEHEVSCKSCVNVVDCIDTQKYNIILVGITKEGEWKYVTELSQIRDDSWRDAESLASLLPDRTLKSLLIRDKGELRLQKVDVIFPVLHGINGEDGTIQGLFELSGIPYVGCGVLASALSMDKLSTKKIAEAPLKALGVRQAKYVPILKRDMKDGKKVTDSIEAELSYPVFIKPSNAGSSCGVSRAEDREELLRGLRKAFTVDRKALVEETILGRELECAVYYDGGEDVFVSGVGEIRAAGSFYDYDAKYNNPSSETDVDPELREEDRETIRNAAKAVFTAVDGFSLSRVDFFLTEDGVVFNEINTLPGFTSISMYPMLMEKAGISKKTLVENLIQGAKNRPVQELS